MHRWSVDVFTLKFEGTKGKDIPDITQLTKH